MTSLASQISRDHAAFVSIILSRNLSENVEKTLTRDEVLKALGLDDNGGDSAQESSSEEESTQSDNDFSINEPSTSAEPEDRSTRGVSSLNGRPTRRGIRTRSRSRSAATRWRLQQYIHPTNSKLAYSNSAYIFHLVFQILKHSVL